MSDFWAFFSAEWTYLLTTRKVGGEDSVFSLVRIKYGSNATDTVSGVIIYPDDFSFSEVGVATMKFGANYVLTQIDAGTWQMLEEAGCVFLPATLLRETNFTINEENIVYEHYWSATSVNASQAKVIYFSLRALSLNTSSSKARLDGYPVRLVQDL